MTLETYTIPMYLAAAYSINEEDKNSKPARDTIIDIAKQEMLHLALAGNLLCAVGGKPRLHDFTPKFPSTLFFTELKLNLGSATKEAIGLFVKVEAPLEPILGLPIPEILPTYESIGQFYNGLETLLRFLDATFKIFKPDTVSKQLDGILDSFPIKNMASAASALKKIVEEGEGTSGHREGSHWDKFKRIQGCELKYHHIVENIDSRDYDGHDGKTLYPFHPVMVASDAAYSFLLLTLEVLWQTSDSDRRKGLKTNLMRSMGVVHTLAEFLIEQPIPGKTPTEYAGPPFRRYEFKGNTLTELKSLVTNASGAYPGDERLKVVKNTVYKFVNID